MAAGLTDHSWTVKELLIVEPVPSQGYSVFGPDNLPRVRSIVQ
jgi:hypothetical protein